jgi:hypothetical protein
MPTAGQRSARLVKPGVEGRERRSPAVRVGDPQDPDYDGIVELEKVQCEIESHDSTFRNKRGQMDSRKVCRSIRAAFLAWLTYPPVNAPKNLIRLVSGAFASPSTARRSGWRASQSLLREMYQRSGLFTPHLSRSVRKVANEERRVAGMAWLAVDDLDLLGIRRGRGRPFKSLYEWERVHGRRARSEAEGDRWAGDYFRGLHSSSNLRGRERESRKLHSVVRTVVQDVVTGRSGLLARPWLLYQAVLRADRLKPAPSYRVVREVAREIRDSLTSVIQSLDHPSPSH